MMKFCVYVGMIWSPNSGKHIGEEEWKGSSRTMDVSGGNISSKL